MSQSYGPGVAGQNNVLNITSSTVLKASAGILNAVSVVTAGSAAGGVYDSATTGGATTATQIGAIAQTVTAQPLQFNWRCYAGITIIPPTGGTVAVSFV